MELNELSDEEKELFAGMVRLIVGVDEEQSPAEMEEFRAIADEMGRQDFDEAFRTSLGSCSTLSEALVMAKTISNVNVRQLILTVLTDLAAADGIAEEERSILRSLADVWGMTVRL